MKGKFITFEGSEGSGKSTQSKLLYGYLKRKGFKVIYLREPGSTSIGEKIRNILLDPRNQSITSISEMLLYMVSRAQAVQEVIQPALCAGKIVVSDRFLDSTIAYQGFGLGIDIRLIKDIGHFVTDGIKPDLTIFMDLPLQEGLRATGRVKDRIEKRSLKYHQKVRQGYFKLAKLEPRRIRVIKVEKNKSLTQGKIRRLVMDFLK